jgi:transposase-like protein
MEKGEKQGRRTYTKEFKLEAVRLVRTGIPKARVSRDLGIHLNVLKAWLRQFDQDPDNPFPGICLTVNLTRGEQSRVRCQGWRRILDSR